MKKHFAVALASLLVAGVAYAAQPPAPSTPPSAGAGAAAGAGASASFTLPAADVTKLKDWITMQKVASVAAPSGFTVSVGATLPMTITLHEIPASAGITAVGTNQFAVVGDQMVLVDPSTRKIVYVFA